MKPEERTFVAIKPDGVKRGLIGKVVSRFEDKGFKIVGMKLLQVTPELAAKHYAEHVGKPFYNRLIYYITSAPIVAMVIKKFSSNTFPFKMFLTDLTKTSIPTIK